jgi:DNA-directed RNA polymerase subunit RPC12/RpoP
MKCDICGNKIEKTFLDKVLGTYITKDSKKYVICSNCQKTLTKEQILEKLE